MAKRKHQPPPTPHRRAGPRGAKPKAKRTPKALPWEKRNAAKLAQLPPKASTPAPTSSEKRAKKSAEQRAAEKAAITEKAKTIAAKTVEKRLKVSKTTRAAMYGLVEDFDEAAKKHEELKPQISECKGFLAEQSARLRQLAQDDKISDAERGKKMGETETLMIKKEVRLTGLVSEATGCKETAKASMASLRRLVRDLKSGSLLFDQKPTEEPKAAEPAKPCVPTPDPAGPVTTSLKEATGEIPGDDADVGTIPGVAEFQAAALRRSSLSTVSSLRSRAKGSIAFEGKHKGKLASDWLISVNVEGVGPALQRLIEDALDIRTPQYTPKGAAEPVAA